MKKRVLCGWLVAAFLPLAGCDSNSGAPAAPANAGVSADGAPPKIDKVKAESRRGKKGPGSAAPAGPAD